MCDHMIYKTFHNTDIQKFTEEFLKSQKNLKLNFVLKIIKLKSLYEILSRLYKIVKSCGPPDIHTYVHTYVHTYIHYIQYIYT